MEEFLDELRHVDPLWSVALVAVAILVLFAARWGRASAARFIGLVVLFVVLTAGAAGAYYGYAYLEERRTLEERRVLEERAASIFAQAVQPGSVLACIDGSPVPAILEGCERSLFAEPQHVAAAIAIMTQRITFLADALRFATTRDPDYFGRIEPLRNSIEADAYGFVGYIFAIDHRCTAESCDRFRLLRDASRVKENIRVRRFEAFMAKHSPAWRASATPSEPQASESPLPPGGERPSVSGVSVGERAGAVAISDPTSATLVAPTAQKEEPTPTAALPAEPAEAPPTPAVRPQQGQQKTKQPAAAKGTQAASAKGTPAEGETKGDAKTTAPRAAAKTNADAASKRSSEPVAGLPRVVPRDYVREQEPEPPAQTSGQAPGAPIAITPQQN